MLNDLRIRLRSLFRRNAVEQELDEELRFHFDREVEKYIRSGMTRPEAERRARLAFGGQTQVAQDCREARGTGLVERSLQDLRYAIRQLRANPTFSAVMVLTLALSIGANSAIFSVIQGVLIKKLPYPNADRLVRIFLSSNDYPKFPLNPFDFRDFRARNRSFEGMALYTHADVQLSGVGEPVRLNAFAVSAGYFRVLGLQPELGREFDFPAELPGNGQQVIVSHRLWRTRFAADPNIVGRKITLNMQPYTVIGVMPAGTDHPGNDYHALAYGDDVDAWWPFTFAGDPNRRGSHFTEGIARLKDGVSVQQSSADLNAVMAQLEREHLDKGWTVLVIPLYTEIVGADRQLLLVLLGAVGIVLLIACANTANLLLARAAARQREIAVRLAMGASRLRVVRQLLTESLAIALAGGALGLALAFGGVKALVSLLPANFPRAHDIHVSAPVFLFTLAVSLATGILFGLAPALQAARIDPKQGLQQGARTSTSSRAHIRLRHALVMSEVSLACVLLIGAGLMLKSFLNLLHLDPGFRQEHALTASLSLPSETYKTSKQVSTFYDRLAIDLNALPGVESAGLGSDLPWTGYDENFGGFAVEGRTPPPGQDFHARYHMATPGYFKALAIPLVAGRDFTAADKANAPQVLIVNQAFATECWQREDVVGMRITFQDNPKTDADWVTIVGEVGDVKDQPNSPGAQPAFWWPEAQIPFPQPNMSVVMRARGNPAMLADALRNQVHQLDPTLAIADVKLMDQVVDASISSPRFAFVLVGLFASLAILLAAIGAYGVIAYTVSQRSQEFGLRLALGASRRNLMRLVLVQSAVLAIPGTALGVLLALVLGRFLRSLIYQVNPSDPLILASVAVLVLAVAFLASWLPARRAARSDPMATLRAE